MTNELGDEIPQEIEEEARRLACAQGVRYVYIDGEYGGEFPAASIGLPKAKRFGSTRYEKCKRDLGAVGGVAYVAFDSPSRAERTPYPPIPVEEIPEPPGPRVGEQSDTFAIDNRPLRFRVVDGFINAPANNPIKAFLAQLLRVDDGGDYEQSHLELRISYYMVAHRGDRRGKWTFGQFAPMMALEEYREIHDEIRRRGWVTGRFEAPDELAPPPPDG